MIRDREDAGDGEAHAGDALPDFLPALAHQLRNTIFCLSAGLDTLALDVSSADGLETVEMLRAETARLGRVATDLDALVSAPAPSQSESRLEPQVRAAVAETLALAATRGVSLEVEARPGAAQPLLARPEVLKRVVDALLENAVLRSAPGQVVRLVLDEARTTPALRAVELRVEDAGPRYADDLLAHALEPFAVRGAGRTGLGLTIAARLAAAFAGSIVIANRPEGGGLARLLVPCVSRSER